MQGQLSEATKAQTAAQTEVKAAELKAKHLAKEEKEVAKKLDAERKKGGKAEKEHAALRDAVAKLRAELDGLSHDEDGEAKLGAENTAAQAEHRRLTREEEQLSSSLSHLDFKYNAPDRKFDRSRVKGTVASNLSVVDPSNSVALEALAGGRLHQVIVDDEETGMLLLTKGGLTRRITLIPLSKIRPIVMEKDKVEAAKKLVGKANAHLAVDLLSFDATVAPAMRHIFGNTLVCADKSAARSVCDKLGLKTVTPEGDLYDPSGTLTGGSRPKAGASVLNRLAQLSALRAQLAAVEASLAQQSAALEKLRGAGERAAALTSALELKQHSLDLQTQTMRSSELGQLAERHEALQKESAEVAAATEAAKAALAEQAKLAKSLAAQIKDFEGNRDERMKEAKAAIGAAEKEAKTADKALAKAQDAVQRLASRDVEADKEMASKEEESAELERRTESQLGAVEAKAAAEEEKRAEYDAASAALSACQAALSTFETEAGKLVAEREKLASEVTEGALELKKIEHRCERAAQELGAAEAACRELVRRHPWIESEQAQFGVAGGDFDFSKKKPQKAQEALAKAQSTVDAASKRVNKKVLSMFETAEQEYADLMDKKEIVEKDKAKIEAVIAELAQKKIEALEKTWAKVNKDFGSIFSTLLPGARAKLEPQEGCPVEEGLVVKVGFGNAWKQSLLELSGGQRSLIALSLVLSLLRFKPAPIYILDEIDAALDLSHTQNIGTMIKAHFKQSQFLVVSLKEGMFNNANVLYRTKFVDGVSTITRTVPAGSDLLKAPKPAAAAAAAGKGKGKAVAERAGPRGALVDVN